MKIPIEWLKEYIQTDKTAEELAESFTFLGLLLDKPVEIYETDGYSTEVLDLEHRMDRSDWLSILGCARDLAAFEDIILKYPEIKDIQPKEPTQEQIVKIEVNCPNMVNRFNTVVFRNVKVKDSPDWLKNRLEAYGIPSINNIVDITNYVMVELGQPMHAQDLAKMEAQEIVIRKARKGDSVTTLLGEKVDLIPDGFVLTQNDTPTVIGGIVGGATTSVDKSTTDIILDAGNYDQNVVRRVSRALKIQNETVLRYDKFLHPKLTEIAIQRAANLILELTGGEYYENVDWYPEVHTEKEMRIRFERIKKISGMEIEPNKIENILNKLEYEILLENEQGYLVKIPYFRTDVEVEDDIVSDILRISNYQTIPITPISEAPPQEITPEIYKFEEKLRDICVNIGLHEHITEPLVKYNENNPDQIMLENALSSDQSALRTSIYETLAPTLITYKKHKIYNKGLFEIGEIYLKKAKDNKQNYNEIRVLEVVFQDSANDPKKTSKVIKKILATLLKELGLSDSEQVVNGNSIEIIYENAVLGTLRYDSFTLFTNQLMEYQKDSNRVISEFRNYKTEDLSLILDKEQHLGPIIRSIKKTDEYISSVQFEESYEGEEIHHNKKGILIRITHNLDEFQPVRKKIINKLTNEYNVEIR